MIALLALWGCGDGGPNTLVFEGPTAAVPGEIVSSLWIASTGVGEGGSVGTGMLLMSDAAVDCASLVAMVEGDAGLPSGTGVVLQFTWSAAEDAAWPGRYLVGGTAVADGVERSLVLARFTGGAFLDLGVVGSGWGDIDTADASVVTGAMYTDRADGRFSAQGCATTTEDDSAGEDTGA